MKEPKKQTYENNSELTNLELVILVIRYTSTFILGAILFAGFLMIVKGYDKDLVGNKEAGIQTVFGMAWYLFVLTSAFLKATEMENNKERNHWEIKIN